MAASKKKGTAKKKGVRAPVRVSATVAAVNAGTTRPTRPQRTPTRPTAPAGRSTGRATPRAPRRATVAAVADVMRRADAAQKQTRAWARRKIGTIRQLMSRVVQDIHTIGTLLGELQRRRAHTALGYRSFEEMLKAEGLPGRTTAYRYIHLAQAYTAKELRALGPAKAMALINLTRETEAHDVARVLVANDAIIGDKPISLSTAADIRRAVLETRRQNLALTQGDSAAGAEKEARAAAQRIRAQLRRRGAHEAQVEPRVRAGRWGVEVWVPTDQSEALR